MDVFHFIERSVQRNPGAQMLVTGKESLTWEEFYRELNCVSSFLIELGLKKGDRVGTLLPNSIENFTCFFGILAAGCVEVSMSAQSNDDVISRAFNEAGISALVCKGISRDRVESLVSKLTNQDLFIISDEDLTEYAGSKSVTFSKMFSFTPSVLHPIDTDTASTALIQYTSGSTGKPKGIALSRENFIHASLTRNKVLKLDSEARILNVLNFSHSCGKSLSFDAVVIGCTLILENGFTPPFKFLNLLKNQRPTTITGPPLLFHYLLKLRNNSEVLEGLKQHVRYLEVGLSPTAKRMFEELRTVFSWCSIINRYGLTENAGAATMRLYDSQTNSQVIGSIGNIYTDDGLEIEFHDEQKKRGTVIVKGRNVMQGYYEHIKNQIEFDYVKQGVKTEDIVEVDGEGNIFPLGRTDDVIKISGELVSLFEVERYFDKIERITEKAVFAIPDSIYGHKMIAVFYSEEPLDKEEVKKALGHALPVYMMPQEIIGFNSPLPKTASGKISRNILVENYLQKMLS